MSLSTSTSTEGARTPVRRAIASKARSTAFSPLTGGVLVATIRRAAPSSRTLTMRARKYNCTATPRVSKPPPRLATEPGTTTSPLIVLDATSLGVLSDTKQKRYHEFPAREKVHAHVPTSMGRASGGTACHSVLLISASAAWSWASAQGSRVMTKGSWSFG